MTHSLFPYGYHNIRDYELNIRAWNTLFVLYLGHAHCARGSDAARAARRARSTPVSPRPDLVRARASDTMRAQKAFLTLILVQVSERQIMANNSKVNFSTCACALQSLHSVNFAGVADF